MAPTLDQITRKEAQAALMSPEELDQLMAVTRARGWITLLVIGGIISVALAWGVCEAADYWSKIEAARLMLWKACFFRGAGHNGILCFDAFPGIWFCSSSLPDARQL